MSNSKYFLYSSSYVKDRNEIEKKLGKLFVPGTVMVDGSRKEYSMLSDTPTINRYSDIRIIAQGDIDTFKYSEPSTRLRKD